MKFSVITAIAVITVTRDVLAVPMDHKYTKKINETRIGHDLVLHKRDVTAQQVDMLWKLTGLLNGQSMPASSVTARTVMAVANLYHNIDFNRAASTYGFILGGIAGGELSQTVASHWGKIAVSTTVMLTTAFLSTLGPLGVVASSVLAGLSILFGALFKKEQRGPTQAQTFSDIQTYVTSTVNNYVSSIQRQELTNEVTSMQSSLMSGFQNYHSSILKNQTDRRIFALDTLITSLATFRLKSESFVSGLFFQQETDFYLLKKSGTNMCFGPKKGADGRPTFGVTDFDTYALYDCTDEGLHEHLKMRKQDNRLFFQNDFVSNGEYCVTHQLFESPKKVCRPVEKHVRSCVTEKPPKWGTLDVDSNFLYTLGTCEEHKKALPNSLFPSTLIKDPTSNKVMIVTGVLPNHYPGNPGMGYLMCGGGCGGESDDEHRRDRCYFAQNNQPDRIDDVSLFQNSNGQCFTTFEMVPYYPAHPPSQIYYRLMVLPVFMRINLVMSMERFVIGRLKNETAVEHCDAYDIARLEWASSFKEMLKFYRMSPHNAVENEVKDLAALEELVDGLLNAPEDECLTVGETIVQLGRANAVLLDQPGLNVTALQEIVSPLQETIASYKSLF